MALLEKTLCIKRSKIPRAGEGLFTKQFIPKGTLIVEYKGRAKKWKEVLEGKVFNGYVYYINRNHVIDAMTFKKALARFANDAKGLTKVKGLSNNSIYVVQKYKVFIRAAKNIYPGEEILVPYGKEYWEVIAENILCNKS
ncbi:MAG: SET domain-containing protein-lysine N-methyltransferase [Ginsengibacter sp.]